MSDTKTSGSINLDKLSSKVISEREDINKLKKRREKLENFKSRLKTKEDDLYNNLSRINKHFFRTGETGTKIIATDNMLEKLPLDFSRIDNETEEKEKNIEKDISSYLCKTDSSFAKLNEVYTEICSIDDFINDALEKIKESLSSIFGAKLIEGADLGTNNIGISIASSLTNVKTKNKIDEIKKIIPQIQRHIERLKLLTKEMKNKIDPETKISLKTNNISSVEDIDIILDLFVNLETDFGSIFSLFTLGKAEATMSEFKKKLTKIEANVYRIKKEIKTIRSNKVKEMEDKIVGKK